MVNAKEKAKELFLLMLGDDEGTHPKVFRKAKDRALIAVDEIINELTSLFNTSYSENLLIRYTINKVDFWQEVKQEIEKL